MQKTHLKPRQVSELAGVGIDTVLAWIHRGLLKASNVSMSSSRPRWLIAKDDWQAFLDARSNQQRTSAKPAKKLQKPKRQYV